MSQEIAKENLYSISSDEAIKNLEVFMESFLDENISRSNDKRTIKNIYALKFEDCHQARSQSELDSINCDKLVYIANFNDNRGYAVLAADERIPNKVISVIDSGTTIYPMVPDPDEWDEDTHRIVANGLNG